MFDKKYKYYLYYFFGFLLRISHWLDVVIEFLICNYVSNSFGKFGFLVYIIPILQLWFNIKTEYSVIKSKSICNELLDKWHIMTFSGGQGCGKSSFACYLSSFKCVGKKYSNEPIKINNKFNYILDYDILNLDTQVDDKSLLYIDEATLYYNNLCYKDNKNGLHLEIYSQEILTQLCRHFFDGWVFYISTDTNRLPTVIRENVFCKNFMLGQENKILSYITAPLIVFIANLFNIKLINGFRVWNFQQFITIPEDNYSYDLSNDELNSKNNKYSNLLQVVTYNNPYRCMYDDRFMKGIYKNLPKHKDDLWQDFNYNNELMYRLGYGKIIDFFKNKK